MGNSVHLVQGSLWQRNLFRKRGEDSPGTRARAEHHCAHHRTLGTIRCNNCCIPRLGLSLTTFTSHSSRYVALPLPLAPLPRCRTSTVLYKTATVHHTSGESTMAFDVFTFFPRIDWTCLDFFLHAWFHVKPAVQSATKRIVSLYPPVWARKKQILLKLVSMVNRAWVIQIKLNTTFLLHEIDLLHFCVLV